MPDKTIPVGLIIRPQGAHLSAYLEALAQTEEVGAVFLADATGETEAQARQVLKKKLQRAYRDTPAMLREGQPSMALVSLEAASAPPEIDAALDAGCHVFSEKPACIRAEDFEPLVRKADSKHRLLMLALANRVTPPVREARRMIKAGRLGRIYGAELHLIADQTRLKQESYRRSWFASKARAGGGHLIWLGIHWLDLAMHITGLSITEVAAMVQNVGGQPIDVEDSATVVFRFENGASGTMTSGYYLDKGYHSHLKFWGEYGWLELGDLEQTPLLSYSTANAREPKVEQFDYPLDQGGYTPFVRAAVRASAGLDEAPISGADGLRALKTVFASYRAAETGQTQSVK